MDEKAASFEFAFFILLHDGLFCQGRVSWCFVLIT